ncbi:MAG: cytochrome P450 [Pseudomonadota bacterium]|nr:cytochrome P450 [Pseudomonadota bacterium]
MSAQPFVPPFPPRGSGPVVPWRGFIGERGRTAVYGWSRQAFKSWHITRNVLGHRVHIPLHPDSIQRVLLDNSGNYEKPGLIKRLLLPTIGRGLLSSDGDLWRKQRKIVAASFSPPAVDFLVPVFASVAAEAMARWSDGRRDMALEATEATMRVISLALFSGDERLTSREASGHINAALESVTEARLQVLLGLPLVPLTPRGFRGRAGQKYLRNTLGRLVRERLSEEAPDDFVTGMARELIAQFPRDEAIDLAVDNAITFYLAGHETTANAISWTLFILSRLPELQDEAATEARAALSCEVDSGLPDRLPLLRSILDETLRLYPSAPRFDREAVASDQLGDHRIEPGDLVSIWPWLVHRHEKLWAEPDTFDHRRFLDHPAKNWHRFQYIPFGGGPRTCVGARFAMAEALAILAVWLAGWRFDPSPGRPVELSGQVTLRPKGGMPLLLRSH